MEHTTGTQIVPVPILPRQSAAQSQMPPDSPTYANRSGARGTALPWVDSLLDDLAQRSSFGYQEGSGSAAEPAALTALALTVHQRVASAARPLNWLTVLQTGEGFVSALPQLDQPRWPTSLAVLAWNAGSTATGQDGMERSSAYAECRDRAVHWLLAMEGHTRARSPLYGHDSTITAWPWVAGTHSWVEPTAFAVLALKATGRAGHERTREAVRMLVDRLLPTGGCNYGNTIVLGQALRPHLQPTGIALAALAGEDTLDPRLPRSLQFVRENLHIHTPTASMCWALIGLAAHGQTPVEASEWLAQSYLSTLRRDPSSYKLSLLALAAAGARCPLVVRTRRLA